MKLVIIVIVATSVFWTSILAMVIARFTAKLIDKNKEVKQLRYNVTALQLQYEEREKRYAKMQSGNANNDFVASLDILRDAERNGGATANAAATANNRRTRQ